MRRRNERRMSTERRYAMAELKLVVIVAIVQAAVTTGLNLVATAVSTWVQ
jgi:hypothetical protein